MAVVKSSGRVAARRTRSVRSGADKVKGFTKPMLATLHDKPFDDPDWIFEIKWDGYRSIAETGRDAKLYSRNGLSFLNLYPIVARELEKIREESILDGEIVVLNKDGKSDFQKLQQYDHNPSLTIVYYVFDCISFKGKSVAHLPLIERKEIVRKILPKSKIIRYSDHVEEHGVEFFKKVVSMDMEGMIAKDKSSRYQTGKRSRDWLKIKHHNTQEAVIAGYTEPRGSREYFGALILGVFEDNKLRYIGHTGTGFTTAMLKDLHKKLTPLKRKTSPFSTKVPVNAAVTWLDPVTVCEVKFTEVTEEGIMRHPVFMGLRIDKAAREVDTVDAVQPNNADEGDLRKRKTMAIDGHVVKLTNQSKLYWPDEKITKGDLINYYYSISKYILPYLKDRPQSLRRNPNGIRDKGFFHKDAGGSAPDWVKTVSIESESADKTIEYILCNDTATLLYLNNLGCIELNPWNPRVSKPDNPDYLVIDLDPSDKSTFDDVIEAALVVKDVLDRAGASGYCKTSGSRGLHIYVPLKARYSYEEARAFAELIAIFTEQQLPDSTTTERSLDKRGGKLYIDYFQNKKGQTLASVYSARPRPGATVSTPLQWKELKKGLHPSQFDIFNTKKRIEKLGDIFLGVLTEGIDLTKCLKKLGG